MELRVPGLSYKGQFAKGQKYGIFGEKYISSRYDSVLL